MFMEILAVSISVIVLIFTILIWIRIKQPFGQDMQKALRDELRESRDETSKHARELREEISNTQAKANEVLIRMVNILGDDQKNLLGKLTQTNEERLDQVRSVLDEKLRQVIEDQRRHLADVIAALKNLEGSQLNELRKARESLDQKFLQIQESNEKKLDEMRKTVDEKLHNTLEKRLGESFKLVSERLEAVQRGLGEMQTLATGVGDLKRVLGNVKERGTWGEYQLGAILSEILTPDQYARNVRTKDGRESVEYAIKLPGKGQDQDIPVWLPIDAKFPREAYDRLVEAARVADADGVESASGELRKAVLKMAKDIQEKYINPPASTDFAILFLPTEGLYAEILRQSGLHDEIQQKHRVLVAGPTTLSAILNSLRVGFQTIAIEKRASEVWTVLGAVKTEFGKFGDFLDKVKKHIDAASQTLDTSTTRTKAMERKLRSVEQLPADQARTVLSIEDIEPASSMEENGNNDLY
jgi:DNA recombination protein RmuC